MIVTPRMYARRKLRHAIGYADAKALSESESTWLKNRGISKPDVIGCYRSRSGKAPAQTIVVCGDSLLLIDGEKQLQLPYREIRAVYFSDGVVNSIEADGLLIERTDGSSVRLKVDDGDESSGTRDSFMFKIFLENVAENLGTG
jgi:hypothetical protein